RGRSCEMDAIGRIVIASRVRPARGCSAFRRGWVCGRAAADNLLTEQGDLRSSRESPVARGIAMSRRGPRSFGHVWDWAAGPSGPEPAATTCPSCGRSVSLRETAAPSSPLPTIPGFVILEELSCSGEAVVYKAQDLRIDRVLALKLLASVPVVRR